MFCSNCGIKIKESAVICICCGFNRKDGKARALRCFFERYYNLLLLGLALFLVVLWFFEPAVIVYTLAGQWELIPWREDTIAIFGRVPLYLSLVFIVIAGFKKSAMQLRFLVTAFAIKFISVIFWHPNVVMQMWKGPHFSPFSYNASVYVWISWAVYILAFAITVAAYHLREGHVAGASAANYHRPFLKL